MIFFFTRFKKTELLCILLQIDIMTHILDDSFDNEMFPQLVNEIQDILYYEGNINTLIEQLTDEEKYKLWALISQNFSSCSDRDDYAYCHEYNLYRSMAHYYVNYHLSKICEIDDRNYVMRNLFTDRHEYIIELLYRNFAKNPSGTIISLLKKYNDRLVQISRIREDKVLYYENEVYDIDCTCLESDSNINPDVCEKEIRNLRKTMISIQDRYITFCIILKPLKLPNYVILWILDWFDCDIGTLKEFKYLELIPTPACTNTQLYKDADGVQMFDMLTHLKKIRTIERIQRFEHKTVS